jgi:chemotaxis response regulator CheB
VGTESIPEQAEQDVTPDKSKPTVVGIGTSAQGTGGSQAVFRARAKNSGLVFVVVVHLAPEHKSLPTDLLQRAIFGAAGDGDHSHRAKLCISFHRMQTSAQSIRT